MAFEEIAAHRQFVANELIAELERVETVARDGSHAMARARAGMRPSVRSTARSACLRSNCVSALAPSGALTILTRNRDEAFFRAAASLLAARTGPLGAGIARFREPNYLK
jgi:hypothetical protein